MEYLEKNESITPLSLGAGGRRFESCYPDTAKKLIIKELQAKSCDSFFVYTVLISIWFQKSTLSYDSFRDKLNFSSTQKGYFRSEPV